MAARMDNLAKLEDDAILQQLADDQIEHLAGQPHEKIGGSSPDAGGISYVPKKAELDVLTFNDEHLQGPTDDQAESAEAFILDSPAEEPKAAAAEHEVAPETPSVNSAVSAKIAELISQLQMEKTAEKTKQTGQEAQANQDESLAEVISGEVLNPEDIASVEARAIDVELPLDDIETTFTPQVSKPETSANLAEEILSNRMAAEDVLDVEDDGENQSDFTLTSLDTPAAALPEPSHIESDEQAEAGQLKNFMITLAIITFTITGLMLGYYLLLG